MSFRRIVCSASTKPAAALEWISEIDEATSIDQLSSSVFVHKGSSINFETLDSKVAAGIMSIMHGDLKRRISMRDELHQIMHKRMLTGRQVAFLMFQHFQICDMEHSMLEFNDLLGLELRGDNLRAFDTAWDDTLLGMKELPEEKYLENLYRKQVKKSKQFELLYNQLEADHVLRGRPRSYRELKSLVRHHLDRQTHEQHLRDKHRYQKLFTTKKSERARGYNNQEEATDDDSENQKSERSTSTTRSSYDGPTGTSPSGLENRPPCREHLHRHGGCTFGNRCKYWHSPSCRSWIKGTCKKGHDCPYYHKEQSKYVPADEDEDDEEEEEEDDEEEEEEE